MTTAITLKFPPKDALITYLAHHPRSSSCEDDVITKVAEIFAKREVPPEQAQRVLWAVLISLKLQPVETNNIQDNMFMALNDCGSGVPIKQPSKL